MLHKIFFYCFFSLRSPGFGGWEWRSVGGGVTKWSFCKRKYGHPRDVKSLILNPKPNDFWKSSSGRGGGNGSCYCCNDHSQEYYGMDDSLGIWIVYQAGRNIFPLEKKNPPVMQVLPETSIPVKFRFNIKSSPSVIFSLTGSSGSS